MMWSSFLDWLKLNQPQMVLTAVAVVVIFLGAKGLRKAILYHVTDLENRHKVRRAISWVSVFLFVGIVAFVWLRQIGNLGLFLSILGAGVALSLQETLLCIAGWALIMIKKPFDIGDRIEIDGRKGDVIDIDVFQSTLLEVGNWVEADQSTGRMLVVPNSAAFRHCTYNYTKGFPFIWNEFSTTVTFESDWVAAKEIMLTQAQEEAERIEAEVSRQIADMQKRYAIHYERLTPIVYVTISDFGPCLTLRYLSPARERRATAHRIAEGILDAYRVHPRIDFAYPTTRFFNHTEEGKRELRPGPPPANP